MGSSHVQPLSTLSGRTFLVEWSGKDDTAGSGVASYDVFVARDGSDYTRWLRETSSTAAYFVGEPGSTYRFYSVARDYVGNSEQKLSRGEATTSIPTNVPIILQITNSVIADVNGSLRVTNRVSGGLSGSYSFFLGGHAPPGVDVNPTNGVLRWSPTCSQANTTNEITVWVADAMNPKLLDATTFSVNVGECIVPSLGRLVLRAGESGKVAVNLISSVPLTNLNMIIDAPSDRIGDLRFEPVIPEICAHRMDSMTNSLHLLEMAACTNHFLIGTQQIGWLHFFTVSNQHSAFVNLTMDTTVGRQTDGKEVRNFATQAGRLVVIGEEPILEASLGSLPNAATITLYAKPGLDYRIESTSALLPGSVWQTAWEGSQTSLFQEISVITAPRATIFYRAVRR